MNWHLCAARSTQELAQAARSRAAKAGYYTGKVFQDTNTGDWYFEYGEEES